MRLVKIPIAWDGRMRHRLTVRIFTLASLILMALVIGCGSGVSKIVFVSEVDGDAEIYVIDPESGLAEPLTDNRSQDINPVWSPDGQRIAFASDRTGNFEVYVMDADGGNVQQLTDNPMEDFEPVWSPDGEQLAFGSRRPADPGEIAVYLMATDGSGVEPTGVLGIPSDWFSTPRGS